MKLFFGKKNQETEEISCTKALGRVEWVECSGHKLTEAEFKQRSEKKKNKA
jgi:hypothetical protein